MMCDACVNDATCRAHFPARDGVAAATFTVCSAHGAYALSNGAVVTPL